VSGLRDQKSESILDTLNTFAAIPKVTLVEQAGECPEAILPFVILKAKFSADSLLASMGSVVDHPGSHYTWNQIATTAVSRLSLIPVARLEEWGVDLALEFSEESIASLDNMVVHAFLKEPLISMRRMRSLDSTGLPSDIFATMNMTAKPNAVYFELGCRMGSSCFSSPFRNRLGWRGITVDPLFENPYVNIQREAVISPHTVNEILEKHHVPASLDLLIIDHDDALSLWRAIQRTRASFVAIRSFALNSLAQLRTYAPSRRYTEVENMLIPDFVLFASLG
jgi:hypothetical protein